MNSKSRINDSADEAKSFGHNRWLAAVAAAAVAAAVAGAVGAAVCCALIKKYAETKPDENSKKTDDAPARRDAENGQAAGNAGTGTASKKTGAAAAPAKASTSSEAAANGKKKGGRPKAVRMLNDQKAQINAKRAALGYMVKDLDEKTRRIYGKKVWNLTPEEAASFLELLGGEDSKQI